MTKRRTNDDHDPHEANPWLTTGEAGRQLGVHPKTARALIIANEVPHLILNVHLRVRQEDLDAFRLGRGSNKKHAATS